MSLGWVSSSGSEETDPPNVQFVATDGTPVDASAVEVVEGDLSTRQIWAPGSGTADYYNLAHHLPQWAIDAWHAKPDDYRNAYPTTSITGYSGRQGDVATGIENASANGYYADLGTDNEYELESMATAPGDVFGVIGDNCRIFWNRNDYDWMLQPDSNTCVLKGVTFDISETFTADAGVIATNTAGDPNEDLDLLFEDIALVGERNQPDGNGPNYTVRPHLNDANGRGLIENMVLADGEYYDGTGSPGGGERTMGFSTDPSPDPGHIGKIALKNCRVEKWLGNGFYCSMNPQIGNVYSDGTALLWDCEAYNCNRGNMRLGLNDMIIGGHVDVSDMPGDLQGQPVVCDYVTGDASNPTEIIGLHVSGNDYQANAIVARNFYYNDGNTAHVRYHKVTMDLGAFNESGEGYPIPVSIRPGTNPPDNQWAELAAGVEAEVDDVYWYDGDPNSKPGTLIEIEPDATMIAPDVEDLRALSEANDEVYIYSGGELQLGSQTHNQGTYTASGLGLEDPRTDNGALPTFGFDYEAAGVAR